MKQLRPTSTSQLLEWEVIRESSCPYASPIVLVRKKDGSLRLCLDYRLLNSKTRFSRWFSTINLASGYNQVPLSELDQPKTAFCTPFGQFRVICMWFWLM